MAFSALPLLPVRPFFFSTLSSLFLDRSPASFPILRDNRSPRCSSFDLTPWYREVEVLPITHVPVSSEPFLDHLMPAIQTQKYRRRHLNTVTIDNSRTSDSSRLSIESGYSLPSRRIVRLAMSWKDPSFTRLRISEMHTQRLPRE